MISLKEITINFIKANFELLLQRSFHTELPSLIVDLFFGIIDNENDGFPERYVRYFINQPLKCVNINASNIEKTSCLLSLNIKNITSFEIYKANHLKLTVLQDSFGKDLVKLTVSRTTFNLKTNCFEQIFKDHIIEKLTVLNLSFTNLNDKGFEYFCTRIANLEELNISGTDVTTLKYIDHFKKLIIFNSY